MPSYHPPRAHHVLLLGGTTEARHLAAELSGWAGVRVTTSLAGRLSRPREVAGEIRTGGFRGVDGLAAWLREHQVDTLVDATHPFAAAITANAVRAARATGVRHVLLRRPGWEPGPHDHWHEAADLADAASLLPGLGTHIFLAVGRQGLAPFAQLAAREPGLRFLIRAVEQPGPPLPARARVLLDRGPFTFEDEIALLADHRIDVLVTKDSGGAATRPKLAAARRLGLPVVVVRRPPLPEEARTVVPDVAGVLRVLADLAMEPTNEKRMRRRRA
jgi:precorrin-6A/cobalt-precorrin-6A reductase